MTDDKDDLFRLKKAQNDTADELNTSGLVEEQPEETPQVIISDVELPTIEQPDPLESGMGSLIKKLTAQTLDRLPFSGAASWETIEEFSRVQRITNALARNGSAALLKKQGHVPIPVQLLKYDRSEPLIAQWRLSGRCPKAPFVIEAEGYNSVYQYSVEQMFMENGILVAGLPERLTRFRNRTEKRVAAPPELLLEFFHPMFTQKRFLREIHNISYNGLSFIVRSAQDVLFQGMEIFGAKILFKNEPIWQGSAVVKRLTKSARIPHLDADIHSICGVRLSHQTPEKQKSWRALVTRILHPNTRTEGVWSEHLWNIFKASGYFNLSRKTPAHFYDLKKTFANTNRKLELAPSIGCRVAWMNGHTAAATTSAVRIYRNTAFGFHTAKIPTDRLPGTISAVKVLRETHLHIFDYLHCNERVKWLICLIQINAQWPKLAYGELPARFVSSGKTCITRCRTLEYSCAVPRAPRANHLEIGMATADEKALLLKAVQNQRPNAYREALDLTAETLDSEELGQEWCSAGFVRERGIIVAREVGRPAAAAILEIGEPGVHLFNLVDVVRLFPFVDQPETHFSALLDVAREWYKQRGRSSFIYLHEDTNLDVTLFEQRCSYDLGEAELVVTPREMFPEMLDHIFEITTSRYE